MYLIFNLLFLLIFIIGLLVFWEKRGQIIISGLFALPQAFLALTLVPIYWNPEKIPLLGVGLEDFLFCFFTGGLVWISVLIFFSKRIHHPYKWDKALAKFVLCIVFGIVSLTILYFLNIRNMVNPFIIMILWSTMVIIFHFEYWKIGLTGAIVFLIIYTLTLKIMLVIWPTFISFWNFRNLSNLMILKMPVEEMIWALLYGASWSLAIAYILDIKILNSAKQLIRK